VESNGWKVMRYADGAARRRRLRCRGCGRTSWPEADGFSAGHRMSSGTEEAIARACMVRSYSAAAAAAGVDEKTAKSVFVTWLGRRLEELDIPSPSVVGLVAAEACGATVALVCDVERLSLFDVVDMAADGRDRRMPTDRSVAAVFCGPSPVLVSMASRLWPGARLAVDPGGFLSLTAAAVGRTLDARAARSDSVARRSLRARRAALMEDAASRCGADVEALDAWAASEPELHLLRLAKDAFMSAWNERDPAAAASKLAAWRRSRHAASLPCLADALDAWGSLVIPFLGDATLWAWSDTAHDVRERGLGGAAALGRKRFGQFRARLLLARDGEADPAVPLRDLADVASRLFPAVVPVASPHTPFRHGPGRVAAG
jgi:hypothetical protein